MLGEGPRTAGEMSGREREVARLYAEGRSYKEIARALVIAPATVRTHLNSIFRKLKVTNKVELLRKLEVVPGKRPSSGREHRMPLGSGAAPETEQLKALLENLALGEYLPLFLTSHIDDALLPTLTDHDLRATGVEAVGHRKRLLRAIAGLTVGEEPPADPPAVTEAVAAGSADRRQLTVMFVDLVGSTALATRLDPEELREVLGAYRNAVADEVTRYGGHVNHLQGDGVLACFGWPRAHEDNPERAVRAGLAAVEAVARLQVPRAGTLACRVGIATGLVVVGDLAGESLGVTGGGIVGVTPNLAARLQAIAGPGTVVIAESTRQLLGRLFTLQDLDHHRLKGFTGLVQAWQVTGEGAAEGRFAALRGASLTPLVGRREELALLLGRWEQAKGGEGQVVLLAGEAGIGKSRLVRALREELFHDPHTPLEHQCSPHHGNSALHPVIGWLERAAGLQREDPPERKLAKLEALLGLPAEVDPDGVRLLADLLTIQTTGRYAPLDLSPQRRNETTFRVLLDRLAGLAARGPVLALHEDVHWADSTTLEFLNRVIDRVQRLPVLVVITFRPEFIPPWTGYGHATALSLGRLGRRHGAAMVGHAAGGKAVPAAVLVRILARADGVPLFLEELTKATLESDLLEDTGEHYELKGQLLPSAIPVTLQDTLMARLDRLASVKEVAQVGAVIGREFSYELLAAATPLNDGALRDALRQLVGAELIFRQGEPPAANYAFKHALVRDAAYESLLKSRRREMHARIAQVLEEQFPETVETQPEVPAYHLTEAGLGEKAVPYWHKAGQLAIQRSAMKEAVAHLMKGLELLEGLPQGPERDRRELDLQLVLGQALIAACGFAAPETGRAYARACELCLAVGGTPEIFPALYGRYVFHFNLGELATALEVARELLRLAEERGDAAAQVTGHRINGVPLFQLGRLTESRAHLEVGLTLYEPERDRSSAFVYAINSRVMCLSWLVPVLLALGYPEQAQARMREALAYARELAHPYTLASAMIVACILRCRHRPVPEARTEAEELVAFATEQGFPLFVGMGTVVVGWALAGEDAVEEGIARMRRGLADYRATGAELWVPDLLVLLAEAQGWAGLPAAGLELLAEALAWVERTGGHWLEAELHRMKGELLLALSDRNASAAEACFFRAVTVAREQGARLWELRAAASLARLWQTQGNHAKALDLLTPIYAWFTEGFATSDLRDAKMLLDNLSRLVFAKH